MQIALKQVSFHVLNMRTRLPFRYGITELTALPHLFCQAVFEIDGRTQVGLASEGLPPKWFTKNPKTSFEQDLADMLRVIRSAFALAMEGTRTRPADSVFELWFLGYQRQGGWGTIEGYPSLLWAFGSSLVERCAIDAACRATGVNFATAVHKNLLGIELGAFHPELAGTVPANWLPASPHRRVHIRHTVGLSDPLTDADIAPQERVEDGLPQSLKSVIDQYKVRYFKIKLCGDPQRDSQRLKHIAGLIPSGSRLTLDGNENFHEVAPLRDFWETITRDATMKPMLEGLLWIEQPLHREVALRGEVMGELSAWSGRPAMIIDESDATLSSARQALSAGYAGTSYKGCKGVLKGIVNACLIASRRQRNPQRVYCMSAEDLATVGPVTLLQDLAVVATLGLDHLERNSHHYFRGLSMYDAAVQKQVLACHGDLYHQASQGFTTLTIQQGQVEIGSVVDAPFGYGVDLNIAGFMPLEQWRYASLEKA